MTMRIHVRDGTARAINTKNGGQIHVQTAYQVKESEAFPEKIEIVHGDASEVLPPGNYVSTDDCFGNGRDGRFGLVFGWGSKLKKVEQDHTQQRRAS